MRAAAFMLVGLVLCVVEWGSCFSGLPSNQNETNASRHDGRYYVTKDELNEMMQDIVKEKIKEAIGGHHTSPRNTDDSLSPEKDLGSTENFPGGRNVNQRDEFLVESREPRELNKKERIALEPCYESFHDLQNSSGFVDKTNFIILFFKEL
jgi:hypothetical protein